MKLRKTLALIAVFAMLGTGCSASQESSVSSADKDTSASATISQPTGDTTAATPANWDEAPTSATSANGEWTETPYEAEFYVIVDCYAREKALLGAKTVSVITRNGKIKVVAKTNTGYYKLPDGTFVHGDYLSVEKPSDNIFSSAGAQTSDPAPDAPASTTTKTPDTPPASSSGGYRWVTEPKYDYNNVKMLMLFGDFPYGKASLAVPPNDEGAEYTPGKSLTGLFVAEADDEEILTDLDGNIIIEGSYDDIQADWWFTKHYIACITYYMNDDGFFEEETYWVTDKYELAEPTRGIGGYFGKHYYYDQDTDTVHMIEYGYEEDKSPSEFNSASVPVVDSESELCGLLSNGKITVPLEYDGFFDASFYPYTDEFEFSSFVDGRIVFYKDDKIYVFDKNGNCVSNGKYDNEYNDNQEQCYHDGYLPVCRNEKWGLIDVNGNEVVPCRFDDISAVWNGKAWAMENGKWGIIEIS